MTISQQRRSIQHLVSSTYVNKGSLTYIPAAKKSKEDNFPKLMRCGTTGPSSFAPFLPVILEGHA